MSTHTSSTWDGLPAAQEPPLGVCVVAYRWYGRRLEILLLHRAHHGTDFEGDWAWTPPSGCRFPGEDVFACALRELYEEAGLNVVPDLTECGSADWPVYAVAVPGDHDVRLIDPEHDRFEWVEASEAIRRCKPAIVQEPLRKVVALLKEN